MGRLFYCYFSCDMKEKILSREVVFDDYFTIEKWIYRYEKDNGELTEPVDRMVFQRKDSVAVIVYNTDSKKVLLVKQFRHCTYDKGPGWIVEALAGMMDEGEQPEETAKREAIEESGYKITNLEKISTVYATPGCCTERMHIYYGETSDVSKVAEGGGLESENEYIKLVTYTLDEIAELLRNDQLNDSKTVIAANYLLKMHGH